MSVGRSPTPLCQGRRQAKRPADAARAGPTAGQRTDSPPGGRYGRPGNGRQQLPPVPPGGRRPRGCREKSRKNRRQAAEYAAPPDATPVLPAGGRDARPATRAGRLVPPARGRFGRGRYARRHRALRQGGGLLLIPLSMRTASMPVILYRS